MRLYLYENEYRYAVEQMLLTMFPEERPEYPEGRPEGKRLEVRLSRAERFMTASCLLVLENGTYRGTSRATIEKLRGKIETDRICQRLIKNAIYKAALSSGRERPVWGALTGVRPGKVYCGLLNESGDEKTATRRFIEEYDVSKERAELCRDTSRETMRAAASLGEKDVCLYVGVPFCPTRCSYCSFVSQSVEKSMKLIPAFVEALQREIRATGEQIRALGLRVVSVYFGGGTPTTLSPEQLDTVCSELEWAFDLSAMREYTVEAGRPDTITTEKLQVLKRHGVGRISVNPQTMSDHVLQTIGRKHTASDIRSALKTVRECGGFAVNMDMIAGLPDDTADGFRDSVEQVLALRPENITIHTLSLKKGSRILLEATRIPSAGEVGEMLDYAGTALCKAGYRPYYLYRQKFMSGGFENVGWTLDGHVNLYNICIMEELCSIIAMGGGGSTKLVRPGNGRNIRLIEPKYPQEYIEHIGEVCAQKEKITSFYTTEEQTHVI